MYLIKYGNTLPKYPGTERLSAGQPLVHIPFNFEH